MKNPLLSIVIANYNYGRFLEEAIQSVLAQSCQDFELIICDGGSTDNSVEIIKKYAGGLPPGQERRGEELKCKVEGEGRNGNTPFFNFNSELQLPNGSSKITYWCSEPDKGQSDAFNKGFAHARGKYLTWLNADDVMLPDVIEKLKKASEKHPECEWFAGGSLWLNYEMRIIKCNVVRPFSEIRYRSGNVSVCGPSSFFTKRLLDAVGGVDVRLNYTMDMKLWFQFRHECGIRYRSFVAFAYGLRAHEDAKTGCMITESGKIDFSVRSEQGRSYSVNEFAMRVGDFPIVPLTLLKYFLSIHWPSAIKGVLLTKKHHGEHYLSLYKEERSI